MEKNGKTKGQGRLNVKINPITRISLIVISTLLLSTIFFFFSFNLLVTAQEQKYDNKEVFDLNNVSLSVDKAAYSLDETVRIRLIAPPEVITNFSIISPSGFFYTVLPSASGEYEFKPDSAGNNLVSVSLQAGSAEIILTAAFEVIESDVQIVFGEPGQSEIKIGEPVNWSRHILIANPTNLSISNFSVNLPLPDDYSSLVSDGLFPIINSSVLVDLAPGESVSFNISYRTSPVSLEVAEESIDIFTLVPFDALGIALYKQMGIGDDEISLPPLLADAGVKRVRVWHNSSTHYHNIPFSVAVGEDEKVYELKNDTMRQVNVNIAHGVASWTIPQLPDRTFIIMQMERKQEDVEINIPVKWQLSISDLIIKYRTPAPYIMESEPLIESGKWKKEIFIGSNASVRYTNVTAFTSVNETEWSSIKLFSIENGSRIDVTGNPEYNLSLFDTDNNSIVDRATWNVPQLGNQTFEIEATLAIIKVQSYPTVGGNRSVRFTTPETVNVAKGTERIWKITKKDYFTEYIDFTFNEINETTWQVNWEWIEDTQSEESPKDDLLACLNASEPEVAACARGLRDKYFPDTPLGLIMSDIKRIDKVPKKALTKGVLLDGTFDVTQDNGSFIVEFPNGWKKGEEIKLGFNSTLVVTDYGTYIGVNSTGVFKTLHIETSGLHIIDFYSDTTSTTDLMDIMLYFWIGVDEAEYSTAYEDDLSGTIVEDYPARVVLNMLDRNYETDAHTVLSGITSDIYYYYYPDGRLYITSVEHVTSTIATDATDLRICGNVNNGLFYAYGGGLADDYIYQYGNDSAGNSRDLLWIWKDGDEWWGFDEDTYTVLGDADIWLLYSSSDPVAGNYTHYFQVILNQNDMQSAGLMYANDTHYPATCTSVTGNSTAMTFNRTTGSYKTVADGNNNITFTFDIGGYDRPYPVFEFGNWTASCTVVKNDTTIWTDGIDYLSAYNTATDNLVVWINKTITSNTDFTFEVQASPDFQVTGITFTYTGDESDVGETGTGDHVNENANVTVNATIRNYGRTHTGDYIYVGFYDGESGQSGRRFANITLKNSTGGSRIFSNTDYYAVAYWDSSLIGTHNISVWVDYTNVTWEGSTANETNNNNSKFINVSAWQKYWGNVSGEIVLADSAGNTLTDWSWSNETNTGYIYIMNKDVSVNWTALHGLGCDKNNDLNTSGNDFNEADTALNMKPNVNNATGFTSNNITQLFSSGDSNAATNTTNFIVHGVNITNVPIVNSTDMTNHANVETANFITGIFWDQDSGSGTNYYDGSQDLIFMANARGHTVGLSGVTDVHNYEIGLPCALNATASGNVDFYMEML